jgi:hypothetical protein
MSLNILQTIFQNAVNPPLPLHAGEAFTLWAYYEAAAETRAICRVLLNHTDDQDLKEMIEHFIADVLQPQVSKTKEVMLNRGIPLPESSPDKPKADPWQIPPGARFDDGQVANMIVIKIQGLLVFCHEGLSRSLQQDLAAMYYAFQTHVLAQGGSLASLMRKRGWLRVPPPLSGPISAEGNPTQTPH